MLRNLAGVLIAMTAATGAQAATLLDNPLFQSGFPDFASNILSGAPASGGTPAEGVFYDAATDLFEIYNGGTPTGSSVDFVGPDTSDPASTNFNGINDPAILDIGELRAQAFITETAALGPAGSLFDGSTGQGVLTITGSFNYDSDGDNNTELFTGTTVDKDNPTQLIYATIVDIKAGRDTNPRGDDVTILWEVNSSLSTASSLFGRYMVTKVNQVDFGSGGSNFDPINPFGSNNGFSFNTDIFIDNRYAEIPLPGALPLFAAGLGALGLARFRRRAA